MALTLSNGSGQQTQVTSSNPPLMPTVGNYAETLDSPGEAIFRFVTGALDQPNTIRFGYQVIPDIFRNSPIEPAVDQRRDGLSLLLQVNEVWKVDDAADSVAALYLPASCHTVVKLPIDALITSVTVSAFMRRCLGAAFTVEDDVLADAIAPLMAGVTSLL